MKRISLFLAFVLFSVLHQATAYPLTGGPVKGDPFLIAIPSDAAHQYIQAYQALAISEMKRTGIPASITLAQGMLESDFGRSKLAIAAKNHFGVKCGNNWKGKTLYRMDDDPQASCFRQYDNVADSYKDHSDFLTDPHKANRYGTLFKLNKTDYKGWAKGLKKGGYASDPKYPSRLITVIESLNLNTLDKNIPITPPTAPVDPKKLKASPVFSKLGMNYVLAAADDTPESIALKNKMNPRRIYQYNEFDATHKMKAGMRIWLEFKKCGYRGSENYYAAEADKESLYEVSQIFGIKLKRLARINRLPKDYVLKKGERLGLNRRAAKSIKR